LAAHGGQPFEGVKNLLLFPIFRFIDSLGLFRDLSHSLLGKRSSDNVSGQVFHGLFTPWLNPGPTENFETRTTPLHKHINQVFSDLAFGKEHLEDLVPEDLLQMFQFE